MKAILVALGIISLSLGIIGIAVPVLPTTPFLLLSATLFARSSEKLYNWLMNHLIFGSYIKSFRDDKSISLPIKIFVISLIWITTLLNILVFVPDKIFVHILLTGISIGVSLHILSFKTRQNKK
jgi:uncharacterized membrane protein YbaN (DUF454 family)